MQPNLRYVLATVFVIVAIVPVAFLGLWVQETAFDKEVEAVKEKHLLIARNITTALERYAKDAEAAFNVFTLAALENTPLNGLDGLARQLGFRHFCLIDDNGFVKRLVSPSGHDMAGMKGNLLETLKALAADEVRFSDVMPDVDGTPTIYMAKRIAHNRVAVGALSTDYMVHLQQSISFGERGHSAIVDSSGNTIAHPSAEWQRTMKNITKLDAVRRMVAGETGVSRFYSPVMKGDMIAGFTTVPGPGWGVMVPQPVVELKERVRDVQFVGFAIGIAGLVTATIIAWLLAGLLVRPLTSVIEASRGIAEGKLNTRVPYREGFVAKEFRALSDGFNTMAHQIQENQEAMEQAIDQAQAADRAKSQFLANVSHELKTPLNAIIGFSEILKGELLGPVGAPRYRDYADDIHKSGERLLFVINDILDVSRIEIGRMELQENTIDTEIVVDECMKLVKDRSGESELSLSWNARQLPALKADERAFKQILLNLLSNAVKFTPAGGRVGLDARVNKAGEFVVTVADTGIGIAESDLETALTPFGQVDSKLAREYEGTGLGLPLAKALAELHGGEILLQSNPGEGTTVTFTMPCERVVKTVQ